MKLLEIKRNPILVNTKYKPNSKIDDYQNNYLIKSNSNYNINKNKDELNKIKKDPYKSPFLKNKYLYFVKTEPDLINPFKYNKNIIHRNITNKNQNNKNITNKNNKIISIDLKKDNNQIKYIKRHQITPNKNYFQIDNNHFPTNKIKELNNIVKKNNKENKSLLQEKNNHNFVSFSKNKKNINIYNKYELLKNQKDKLKLNNIYPKDDDNLYSINSITKYNTEKTSNDFNKPEENKPLNNKINIIHVKKESLYSKMNINTNLSIDEELKNYYETKLNINIEISSKTIFTIYNISNKIYILCFDFLNKKFSLRDFADFGKFEENYKFSLNNSKNDKNCINKGNLFLSKGPYLYIVTGKNYDMLYVYDSIKKSMNKLCNLQNNHSNGAFIDFNEDSLLCISGNYNKKVELFSIIKNEWKNNLSETLIERSNCAFCLFKKRFIFLIFGKNYPTNEYLNTIEYYDLNNINITGWKYLNIQNKNNLVKMNICNGYGINFMDEKIILVGGYNGFEKEDEKYFVQIEFGDEYNFENNNKIYFEKTDRKLKDIEKNKKYYFNGGQIIKVEKENEENKNLFFLGFDNKLNCHVIQISNLAHDIYYHFKK